MAEEKAPLTEEQKIRRRAGRRIGYYLWKKAFQAANPNASKADRSAAWKEERKEQTREGMQVLKSLRKSGVDVCVLPAEETDAAEETSPAN